MATHPPTKNIHTFEFENIKAKFERSEIIENHWLKLELDICVTVS